MGKISNYTQVSSSKLADKLVCDQEDSGVTSTKSVSIEQIGNAVNALQVRSDLDTRAQTIVSAINEIASYTPVYNNTASGAIATFDTSLALPLQDLQISINAVQEAGTPTPSSPKLISGFTGANIHVADDENPHVIDNVTAITWQTEAGTVYGGSLDVTSGVLTVTHAIIDLGDLTWTYYMYGSISGGYSDTKASEIKLPSSGSVLTTSVSNKLTQTTDNNFTSSSDYTFTINTIGYIKVHWSGVNNSTELTNALIGTKLVYPLATPQTYQLTPTQISAIVGTNNVFADTNGDTSVVYACSLKDYIDGQ